MGEGQREEQGQYKARTEEYPKSHNSDSEPRAHIANMAMPSAKRKRGLGHSDFKLTRYREASLLEARVSAIKP